MSELEEFDIGREVVCSDGVCGDLRRVVVGPVARAITHLVVEPRHRRTGGHLVPVDLSFPYFGLGVGTMGMGGTGMGGTGVAGLGIGPHEVARDRVPVGEVEVRRGEHVEATDGPIGRLGGLVVDPRDHHVTHVLLDEGHLWGDKRVAIPIGAVTSVTAGIRLNLSKDEVRDLPPVELDQVQ